MSNLSWSYSAYSKALDCLACFNKRYILKEPETGLDSSDLLFGSCCHSAWNAMLTGEDEQAVFDIYWKSYEGKPMQFGRFKYGELEALGKNLLRKFRKYHAERFKIDKSEVRLYGEYKGIKLEGQYDFWGLFDGKLSLIDLKTSAYNYPKEKQFTALQLNLYCYLAMQNGYGTPERLGYVVLNKGTGSVQEPLVWDFDEKKCLEMLDDMTDYCRMFEKINSYPRNPNCQRHNYDCYIKENR